MISLAAPLAIPLAAAAVLAARAAGAGDPPIRPPTPIVEEAEVTRGLRIVRIDPRLGASPGECDTLAAGDLSVTVGGVPGTVVSVERVPRPERHWLMLDISGSAEGRRDEAKRSAREYVREVMTPGEDVAALVTIDEDTLLVVGPTTDAALLDDRIAHVPPGGTSALRDGLADVLRQIEGDRHEHLILYWTDGQDTQSLTTPTELLALLDRVPNATIFPIALLPTHRDALLASPIGPFLFDVALRSGGEVFASSDPRWLDRVRGWIGRRFTVTFASDARVAKEPVFKIEGKRCQLTVLRDPFALPDAVSGEAPPAPEAWVRLHARQGKKTDDAACAAEGGAPWDWPLRASPAGLEGCALDFVEAPGPLITSADPRRAFDVAPARVAARAIRVRVPSLSELPASLEDAFDALIPPEGGGTEGWPGILEGSAFLAERARIATSLFASRPEYRDFALARLGELARDELGSLEADLRREFPSLPPREVAAAARASRAGRRALLAAAQPSDADLARVLAAWLRDVPASEALAAWERRLIDRRIVGKAREDDGARWQRLRDRLAVPWRVRVVAPLVAIHDPEREVVGFERIVLPRPEGFDERFRDSRLAGERVDDRVPDRPYGLALADTLCASAAVARRLAERGYRAAALEVAPLDPSWKTTITTAYRRVAVSLTLASADGSARAVFEAQATGLPGEPTEVGAIRARADGDAALADALTEMGTVPFSAEKGTVPVSRRPHADRAADPG